jgi:hypothetical protein
MTRVEAQAGEPILIVDSTVRAPKRKPVRECSEDSTITVVRAFQKDLLDVESFAYAVKVLLGGSCIRRPAERPMSAMVRFQ